MYSKISNCYDKKNNNLNIIQTRNNYSNTRDPKLWGPPLWLSLHIFSVYYDPKNEEDINRCISFIKNLPYQLPCFSCSEHAKNYIKDKEHDLHQICRTKKNLFEFYVDFHNYVNIRNKKRTYTYEEAWDMYSNGINMVNFSY